MNNMNLAIGLFLISISVHMLAWCLLFSTGFHFVIPKGVNVFALLMIALNIGAAIWGFYHDGVNQLVYGLAAAVLNICVYINFDRIISAIKGAL